VVIKVPMLAFVITVYQVSAYAVAPFRRAMLLLHVTVLVNLKIGSAVLGVSQCSLR
jgi:hypothetical protein